MFGTPASMCETPVQQASTANTKPSVVSRITDDEDGDGEPSLMGAHVDGGWQQDIGPSDLV